MTVPIGDLETLIWELNDGAEDFDAWEFRGDGEEQIVLFCGQTIWNSAEDERETLGETDSEYESLKVYLIRGAETLAAAIAAYIAFNKK